MLMCRVRTEVQLAAPAKKLSVKRSQRKKQAAAANAAADADADTGAGTARDQGAATPAAAAASADARPLFLSLGLSPFCQMDNSRFNFDPAVQKGFEKLFELGDAFYPFKALAAAKAKYGAGLHNSKFEDPAVQYNQAYFCHRRGGKGGRKQPLLSLVMSAVLSQLQHLRLQQGRHVLHHSHQMLNEFTFLAHIPLFLCH